MPNTTIACVSNTFSSSSFIVYMKIKVVGSSGSVGMRVGVGGRKLESEYRECGREIIGSAGVVRECVGSVGSECGWQDIGSAWEWLGVWLAEYRECGSCIGSVRVRVGEYQECGSGSGVWLAEYRECGSCIGSVKCVWEHNNNHSLFVLTSAGSSGQLKLAGNRASHSSTIGFAKSSSKLPGFAVSNRHAQEGIHAAGNFGAAFCTLGPAVLRMRSDCEKINQLTFAA